MTRYVLDARTVTHHFPGIGRYVINLGRAMIPLLRGDEALILLYDPSQPSAWDLTQLAGAQIHIIEVTQSPFSLSQQWVLPPLLDQLGADVYHSPYYLMPYRPGKPTLLTMYDLIPLRYPQYSSMKVRFLFRWTTALALRVARLVTAISEATRHDLLATYSVPPAKVKTVSLAADPNFSPASTESIAALRMKLNLPPKYALYFGSNKPHKNLVRLIEAWSRLRSPSVPLVIAGVWDSRYPEAKQRAEMLGLKTAVHFLGPVPETDIPSLYSGATLFVFPSEYEGFGLPVLEAMACGTPVACAETSSLSEIATGAALMFAPTDVEQMASSLERVLSDVELQTELREQGFCRAAEFSWQRTAQETLNLYRLIQNNSQV